MLKETLKRKKEPALTHPGRFLLPPLLPPMPSTVGSVARSFAFCGPALGMKGRKSQPLRIRESLGQSRRNEDALPGAGCIWGPGERKGLRPMEVSVRQGDTHTGRTE